MVIEPETGIDTPEGFDEATLKAYEDTHIAIYVPPYVNLWYLYAESDYWDQFYTQTWWEDEPFSRKADEGWHLIPILPSERFRGRSMGIPVGGCPSAITLAYAFCRYLQTTKEMLWKHDFLWTSDFDRKGQRIYVGQPYDPDTGKFVGFQIHRHLNINEYFSYTPEITSISNDD